MSRKYVHNIFLTIISTENTCQIFFDVLSDHAKALVDKWFLCGKICEMVTCGVSFRYFSIWDIVVTKTKICLIRFVMETFA